MSGGDSYIVMCNSSILPIYPSFLFDCNYWDDWDRIWHVKLGSIGDSFIIMTSRITVFLCLVVSLFSFW